SVADELLSQGMLSPADYPNSPLRHQLTKSLGASPRSDPDIFPHADFGSIAAGETILLCSDGFYAKLNDIDFAELAASKDLNAGLQQLADRALSRGTSDNLSAVVIRVG
ncbi:MAG TPA: hypothetical protein VK210_04910, partial [Terriglobia bacterium]|nr:hypothetical protein [Terriglobia bacterium]